MAVIKIWDIKDSLRRLLVYITNPKKTKNENYTDDPSAMPYFISGINCDSDMAYEEMMITKQQYQKSGGILAFHAVQSFKPGEITPELAHQLGVEYAKEMDLKLIPYELSEGMEETRRRIESIRVGWDVAVFIGPEGGFTEEEIELAGEAGIIPVTLGKRILRTETAGFTVLSWLMYRLEGQT